jgi:hypothetical protein
MEEGPRRETEEAVGGSSVDTMRTFAILNIYISVEAMAMN